MLLSNRIFTVSRNCLQNSYLSSYFFQFYEVIKQRERQLACFSAIFEVIFRDDVKF